MLLSAEEYIFGLHRMNAQLIKIGPGLQLFQGLIQNSSYFPMLELVYKKYSHVSHDDQLPVCLIAQLVEHYNINLRVLGLNLIEVYVSAFFFVTA